MEIRHQLIFHMDCSNDVFKFTCSLFTNVRIKVLDVVYNHLDSGIELGNDANQIPEIILKL